MPPKRKTIITTTTPMKDAQIKALIAQGVIDALAERDTNRSRNDVDSHDSGSDRRRRIHVARENDLTWWNSHVKTVGHDAAYGMPWKTLMKMMTDKYCPRREIKKLEIEIWNLKVKGTDVERYTQRFQELALLCGRMFPDESDKVEKPIRRIHQGGYGVSELALTKDHEGNKTNTPNPGKAISRIQAIWE
ncbi:reverse transcriptase domain-containing protein [Tanacetum coccineum]